MLQDAERFLSTAQFSHFIVKIQTFGRRSPEEMCVAPRVSAADGCPMTTMADYGGLSTPGPWPPAAIHVTFKKMLSARSAGGRVARNDGQSSCFLGFDKKKSWNRSIWRWKSRRWAVSQSPQSRFPSFQQNGETILWTDLLPPLTPHGSSPCCIKEFVSLGFRAQKVCVS